MAATKWILDPTHSEVEFKVKHMMISTVSGKFTQFEADVQTEEEDFTTAKVNFTIDVNSITTGNEQRDGHLKAPDFFETAKFPQIRFTATKYENVDNDGSYEIYGDLTIRDVTRQVKLDAEFGGVIKDPWGNTRAGITVSGKINRKEFGLQFHAVTEAGNIVLSDEVRIHVGLEFIKA
ncbi:YceI family protein [Flavitalea sp. BT771]|uniref:YceI family protein n=1 Tax=Flavitalea sp. BT771 TaxID=3063329 RepID=UPI0026E2DFBB|nr:YceI family protein [Flavitalea sp. BT771]MDO6431257.1 YceI family protein [Flavitalea sp. BT771]MDV6220165.1 YceI family protein [Flavitalea sp. BT771]